VRVAPGLLTYVSFGGGNGGMVLDVCEGGLALATALAIPHASVLEMTIPADTTHGAIEATGRVVWIADSRRRLGVRLTDVTPRTREILQGWVAGAPAMAPAGELPAMRAAPASSPTPPEAASAVRADPQARMGAAWGAVAREESYREASARREKVVRGEEFAAQAAGMLTSAANLELARNTHAETLRHAGVDSRKTPRSTPGSTAVSTPGTTRSRSFALGAAFVVVVLGGFALGIAIGRNVLARWNQGSSGSARYAATVVAASQDADMSEVANQPLAGTPTRASATTSPTTSAPGANGTTRDSQASSSVVAGTPLAATLLPLARASAERVSADLAREDSLEAPAHAADPAASATFAVSGTFAAAADSADSALPGGEIQVTPNEGDTALRVDLGEEVIAHSPSLEIRSRRFAFVPGVAPSKRHKPRKERLDVGILVSRVTPQPPAARLAAMAAQGGGLAVAVRATIAGDGHIVSVEPLSGSDTLMASVLSAVREWRYDPSALNGNPIETQADLIITFRPLR
jgi:hypothetical protein